MLLLPYVKAKPDVTPASLYENIAWLRMEPVLSSWAASSLSAECVYRSPEKSNMGFYRNFREACLYFLRRDSTAMPNSKCKIYTLCFRRQMLRQLRDDLSNPAIRALSDSDRRLIGKYFCKALGSLYPIPGGYGDCAVIYCQQQFFIFFVFIL